MLVSHLLPDQVNGSSDTALNAVREHHLVKSVVFERKLTRTLSTTQLGKLDSFYEFAMLKLVGRINYFKKKLLLACVCCCSKSLSITRCFLCVPCSLLSKFFVLLFLVQNMKVTRGVASGCPDNLAI